MFDFTHYEYFFISVSGLLQNLMNTKF